MAREWRLTFFLFKSFKRENIMPKCNLSATVTVFCPNDEESVDNKTIKWESIYSEWKSSNESWWNSHYIYMIFTWCQNQSETVRCVKYTKTVEYSNKPNSLQDELDSDFHWIKTEWMMPHWLKTSYLVFNSWKVDKLPKQKVIFCTVSNGGG